MFSTCEHQIAAILTLAEELNIAVFPEYPKEYYTLGDYRHNLMHGERKGPDTGTTLKWRNASEPYEIIPPNDLKAAFVNARKPYTRYPYGSEVKDADNHVRDGDFYFEVRENYYVHYSDVHLFSKEDKWFTECSCGGAVSPFCIHEYLLLDRVVHSWNAANMLDTEQAAAGARGVMVQEFKIVHTDIDKHFQLGFAKGKYYYRADRMIKSG